MAKFNKPSAMTTSRSPVQTTGLPTVTYEGGLGWVRNPKSELFLLAVTNMVGEDTFYEQGVDRDMRFVRLVNQVTKEDPLWVARFVTWLRNTGNMRSAALVMACEYVSAGGPHGRAVVSSALQRADECAETISYWHATHGRNLPAAIKRGVADAATRLFTQRAVMRYGSAGPMTMADVVELTHPTPKDDTQSLLFKYLIDKRHGRENVTGDLPMLWAAADLDSTPVDQRRALLTSWGFADRVYRAGFSWERLSGWINGPMDADAWRAVIPSMGYMALLRNLRNFDQQGITDEEAKAIADRLSAPSEVLESRQFPIRFYSAYKEAGLRWSYAMEVALRHSLDNVPELKGDTLILLDVSGSMYSGISGRSQRQRWEVAAVFAGALAARNPQARVTAYDDLPKWRGRPTEVLPFVERIANIAGGGTNTFSVLKQEYRSTDKRVIIITDEQAHDSGRDPVSPDTPVYTINVAGYRAAHLPSSKNRHAFGGLTDAMFSLIPLLERGAKADWPF